MATVMALYFKVKGITMPKSYRKSAVTYSFTMGYGFFYYKKRREKMGKTNKKRGFIIGVIAVVAVLVTVGLLMNSLYQPNHSAETLQECVLTVKCDKVLENMDKLKIEKKGLIPKDGIIFSKTVAFKEGDSAFDILKEEMEKEKIHFEFNTITGTTSKYIEGINNLYQFDCGDMSGWLYYINNQSPSVACSDYMVKAGDSIVFDYSCDFSEGMDE